MNTPLRPIPLRVCRMDEVPLTADATHNRLLSLVDPDAGEVFRPDSITRERHLILRFHDLIDVDPVLVAPNESDVKRILDFGERAREDEDASILIHCHMGISRSTAALSLLLAQAFQDDIDAVFPQLISLRPEAWPNSRIIEMGDRLLGLEGKLTRSLRELYQHQIIHRPDVTDIIRRYNRGAEIKWALHGGQSPADWIAGRKTSFEASPYLSQELG